MENPPQNQWYEEEQSDEEQQEQLRPDLLPPLSPPPPGFLQLMQQEGEREKFERIENDGINHEDFAVYLDRISLQDLAKARDVFDEEVGSDTLPSDQASPVIVDTNGVVGKEIPPLQFFPTAQQMNSDEDFGNEEGEIRAERTEEGGIPEVQFDSKCSAKRKWKEKTPIGERRDKKTTGKHLKVFYEEVGPPLNSDTLPSDQASAVIVDTNGVVGKEIPPLQFFPTAQQKNSDEDFGNEEGEIRVERTEESGIPEVQFDSRCSAKRKRKEKTPIGERRDKKTTGKHLKGGTSRNTSMGGLAESNVDINTVGGRASSKKWLTSFSGKGGIKIKNSYLTELTSENEGEVLYNRTFRASLRGIIMLIKELNLRTSHKEVLKRTPFWGIFEAIIDKNLPPTQCRKSDKMIIEIINTYDPVAGIFRLGTESVELTRADMVSVFGISCGNEFVSLKYGSKEEVKLVARREISESRLTSRSMKQLLKKYLGSDEKDDVEDVARLLCLYLFHTFLLPTGTTVKWVYLERLEDLDRLRGYDWNGAIIDELMSSIRKHHHEPRKVTGCVMALLYWLCEHTNLSKPLHPEHPLGIAKWDIPLVVSAFKKIRLKDLKPGQVVSRQANVAGTADDEVPMDKDIVLDSLWSVDEPVSNRGKDACSVNGESDEKTLGGERANNRTTGVRIGIALEDILQVKDMRLKDAARELQVSQYLFKRFCWEHGISKWPPRGEHKLIGQSCPKESPTVVDQERIPQLNSDTLLPSNALANVDTSSVIVKVRYQNNITLKFSLSGPWNMVELEQQVSKRLRLDAETCYFKYRDEDNDLILIACDEDLQYCISRSRALGTTSIELLLEAK